MAKICYYYLLSNISSFIFVLPNGKLKMRLGSKPNHIDGSFAGTLGVGKNKSSRKRWNVDPILDIAVILLTVMGGFRLTVQAIQEHPTTALVLACVMALLWGARRLARHYPFWTISIQDLRWTSDKRPWLVQREEGTGNQRCLILTRSGSTWEYRVLRSSLATAGRYEGQLPTVDIKVGGTFVLAVDDGSTLKGWKSRMIGYRQVLVDYHGPRAVA